MEALKWLLRYLNGTIDCDLMFKHNSERVILKGYVDFDYAGDRDKRRSTTSCVFTLCRGCIRWRSQF